MSKNGIEKELFDEYVKFLMYSRITILKNLKHINEVGKCREDAFPLFRGGRR